MRKNWIFLTNIYKRAINIIWFLMGTFISQIIGVISSYVLLMILGTSDFGIYIWIYSGYLTISGVTTSSILIGATKFSSELNINNFELEKELTSLGAKGLIITLSFLLLITVLLVSFGYLTKIIQDKVIFLSFFFVVAFFLDIKKNIYLGILNGLERFKDANILKICESVVLLIFGYVGAKVFGVIGVILGIFASFFIRYILFKIRVQHLIKNKSNDGRINKNRLTNFIVHTSLCGIFVTPSQWVGSTKLIEQGGSDELASFNIINQWRSSLLILSNAANTTLMPSISSKKNKKKYLRSHILLIITNVMLTSFASITMLIISPYVLDFYKLSSSLNITTFRVLLLVNIANSYSNTIGTIFTSKGSAKVNNLLNISWFVLFMYFLFNTSLTSGLDFSKVLLNTYIIHTLIITLVYLIWEKNVD